MRRIKKLDFSKLPEETINEYICRLGLAKKEENLVWKDIIELVYKEFGIRLTYPAVRFRYRRSIKNYTTVEYIPQKISDLYQLDKVRQERLQLGNYYKVLSREETLKEIGIESAKLIAEKNPIISFTERKELYSTKDEGILLISDWHYGVNIDSYYNVYNTEVAKERIDKLYSRIKYYMALYDLSTLNVINLGDMIAGNIHLPLRLHSQIDVMTQILEVSELIAQFIAKLSEYYNIKYYSTLDNHSRIDPNKKDSIQLETLQRITPWYLKQRFKDNRWITIFDNNNYTPDIVSLEVANHSILAVHGDKDKPKQIVDRLTAFTEKHHDLICLAHYHHFSCNEQNYTMVVSNGSLMGTDEYAMDLRLSSDASQTFIVCTPDNVCKHICKIILG